MNRLVVDASVVIKWVVPETGTSDALALLTGPRLVAPELVVAECANILWKKVRRGEVTATQAEVAARLLEQSAVELLPMRNLMRSATDMAVCITHPAYDCFYLSLAVASGCPLVTADESLARKVRHMPPIRQWPVVLTLTEATANL